MKRRNRRTRDRIRDDYSDYFDEDEGPSYRPTRPKRERDPNAGIKLPSWVMHLMILAVVTLLLLGLVWLVAGLPVLEKTLQALAAPAGLLWVGLFLATYFCLLNRQGFPALLAFVCWLLLTVAGNSLVAAIMLNSLQGQYSEFDSQKMEPLDVVAVLGGGLMTLPNGKPQITEAGDRALQAFLLFRNDKVDRIICSGTSGLPLVDGEEMTQADALESLLISLGVPQEKILKIGGRNTLQEMQAFDKWITENNGGDLRKGIITSAWHLPRAMRLAGSVGITAKPIPADFKGVRIRQSPNLLIPGSRNIHVVTQCLKEWLAGLIGR